MHAELLKFNYKKTHAISNALINQDTILMDSYENSMFKAIR